MKINHVAPIIIKIGAEWTQLVLGVWMCVCCFCFQLHAQGVDIPDLGLRSAIEKTLGKQEGEPITQREMEGLNTLVANDLAIKTLSGIEHAVNLQFLYLDNNQLADVSPLTSLTRLEQLSLSGNALNSVPALKGLTELEYLEVMSNQISDLSFLEGMSSLKELWLQGNPLGQIEFPTGLTGLRRLEMFDAQVTTFKFADDWENLGSLNLSQNQIKELTFTHGARRLRNLTLVINQVSQLQFPAFLRDLSYVDACGNPLNRLVVDESLTNLRFLGISGFNNEAGPMNTLSLPAGIDIGTRGPWHFPQVNLEGANVTFHPTIRDIHISESGMLLFALHAEAGNYSLMQSTNLLDWMELGAIQVNENDVPDIISHGAMTFRIPTGEVYYQVADISPMNAVFYRVQRVQQ